MSCEDREGAWIARPRPPDARRLTGARTIQAMPGASGSGARIKGNVRIDEAVAPLRKTRHSSQAAGWRLLHGGHQPDPSAEAVRSAGIEAASTPAAREPGAPSHRPAAARRTSRRADRLATSFYERAAPRRTAILEDAPFSRNLLARMPHRQAAHPSRKRGVAVGRPMGRSRTALSISADAAPDSCSRARRRGPKGDWLVI